MCIIIIILLNKWQQQLQAASYYKTDHLLLLKLKSAPTMCRPMTTDKIIEDLPHHRKRREIRFDDTEQIHVVKSHCETVAPQELWYTESDFRRMKLAEKSRRRLAELREQRSSLSFTKKQLKTFADETRQDAILSLEPNVIPPVFPVEYAKEICDRMRRASIFE